MPSANTPFRSGFVAIIGRPNVGKSTLLNAMLGQRIAITTPKPQTTRDRILGIHHFDSGQILFLDTPGIHKAREGLNQLMVETALAAVEEADLVYFMVEVGPRFIEKANLGEGNERILEALQRAGKPVFLVINKIDSVKKPELLPFIERVKDIYPFEQIFLVSASKGDGVQDLLGATEAKMPEGPPYFPDDMVTDKTLRFMAAEFIREKTMLFLEQELPYSIGVEIEIFKELDGGERFHIEAAIYVERESQKGIVIGHGGQMIRQIGEAARKEMEANFEKPVGLKLFVKVKKDWTLDPTVLNHLGYKTS